MKDETLKPSFGNRHKTEGEEQMKTLDRWEILLRKAKYELEFYHENLEADKEMKDAAYDLLKLIHRIEYELEIAPPTEGGIDKYD